MNKYFKLGTALALTVLVNFAPISLPDVKAETTVSSTNTDIVEKKGNPETIIYAEEISEAYVPSEEVIEVSAPKISLNNETSSAEANNVLKSAPARAPTEEQNIETKNSTEEVGLLSASEEPTKDAEEPENNVVRIHIKDNRTGEYKDYKTYEYEAGTSIGDNVKNGLNMYSIFGLGTQYSASTTKFTEGDYTYTFEGWYLDENNANAFTNTSGVPNSDFESGFSRFAISTSTTSYPYGIRVTVLNELEATNDYYIYANWVKSVTPKVIVNWHDSVYTLNGTKTINSGYGSSLPNGTIPETVTVNGKKYNFLGWSLTENGELIDNVTINGDDENPNNDVPLEYRPNYRKVMVTAKTSLQTVETVDLYAIWEEEYVPEPHKLTINYWDVKPDGTYIAKTISNNISPGVTWTQRLPIDQIFDAESDRPYTGFNKNSTTNKENDRVGDPVREYTLLGWYDAESNGTKIDENYVLNADYLKGLTAISTENNGPWAISFTSRNVLDEDVVINFYSYWDVYYLPVLTNQEIDNLGHSSKTDRIVSGSGAGDTYTTKFKNGSDVPAHYELLYWKYDDNNDQTDDTKTYNPGDTFTYFFKDENGNHLYPSGWTGTITSYAWYQPSVTLNVFKEANTSLSNTYLIHSDESTIAKDNIVVLDSDPKGYGYEKPGYDFVGYYMLENGVKKPVDIGTVFNAPDPTTVPVDRLVYNVFAEWVRIEKNVAITKVWNDAGKEDYRPESLTLNVYATDSEGNKTLYKEVTLEGEGNTWTSEEFTIYPFDEQGNAITYTVEEQSIDCYQTTTDNWTLTENGLTIENTINEDGKVTIIYQTVDGQILEQSEINKPIDADFTAQPKTYENYALDRVEVNGNEVEDPTINGKITSEEQTIIYYYDITIGNVYIYHVDPEGHLIDVDRDGNPVENYYIAETRNIGDSYADIAVPKTIAGYKHNAEASTNFSGDKLITKKDTHIFFVYDPIGKVVVKYLEQGTDAVLAEQTNKEGVVGTEYATAAKTDITNYQLVTDPDHTSGTYTAESYYEPEVIIYYYELKDSNLYVHHIDAETGNNLVDPVVSSEKIGTPYETSRLDGEEYDIYDVVRTEGDLAGEYAAEDIHVYYYYQKQKGTVTATYLDNKTLEVIKTITTEGTVTDNYETEQLELDGYRYVNVIGDVTGTYKNKEDIKVYYFYERVGKVIINHLDINTNEVLVEVDPKVGTIGSEYTTKAEDIEGYHLVRVEGEANGTYTDEEPWPEPIEVTYYYEKDKVVVNGDLKVYYIDTDNNQLDYFEDTKEVGTEYTTEDKVFEGYTRKLIIGNPTGVYEEGTTEVTYVYAKNPAEVIEEGEVVVSYITTDGNKLVEEDVVIPGKVGDEYTTEEKTFEGYELVSVHGATTGTIEEGTTEVVYIYKEKEDIQQVGTVIAHYVDEAGNAIVDDVIIEKTVGSDYYTSQKAIKGYVGTSIPENRIGKVVEGITDVYYTYKKVEEEEPSTPEDGTCTGSCCNCCNSCCNNNCNNQDSENNQPVINIDITINNENNSDNHSENNTNNEVHNDTNVDNHNDINNENNNQDETNVNIENNPTVENNTDVSTGDVTTGDTNVTTGDTTVTTGDTNVENSTTTGDVNVENNPTNTVATGDTNVEIGDITNTSNSTTGEITNTNTAEGGSNTNNNSTEIKDNTITNNVEGGNSTNTNTAEGGDSTNTNTNTTGDSTSTSTTGDNTQTVNTGDVTTGDNTQTTNTGDNTSSSATGDNNNQNNNNNENNDSCTDCNTPSDGEDKPTPTPTPTDPKVGTVVANFLDEEGNIIAAKVTSADDVNKTYTTNAKDIKDYELVKVEGEEVGKYIDGEIVVNYIYKKTTAPEEDPKPETDPVLGEVKYYYIDTEGNEIATPEKVVGEVNKNYYDMQKDIEKYEFVKSVGETEGIIEEGSKTVIYIYKLKEQTDPEPVNPEPEEPKIGKVVAHYINIYGQKLRENVETSGEVAKDDYNTRLKAFKDYEFVQVVGPTTGKYQNGAIDVYYIYKKVEQKETTPVEPEKETGKTTGVDTITYKTPNRVEVRVPNTGLGLENENTNNSVIILIMTVIGGFVYSLKKVFE